MKKLDFYHKILKHWMNGGQKFDEAVKNIPQPYNKLFKKHRSWDINKIKKNYPEYNL